MSPYEINLLLHIYAIAEPIRKCPILADTLSDFSMKGWIEVDKESIFHNGIPTKGSGWGVTKLGRALVNRICEVNTDGIKFCGKCGQLIE